MINIPRLMNKMIVKAHQNGKKIDENYADKSLVGLITKRFNTPQKKSNKAIQIFNDLDMLSGLPKHKSSGKSKSTDGNVYYTTPEDLMNRLKLMTGTRKAGTNNIQLRNEAWKILDELIKLGVIDKTQYDKNVKINLIYYIHIE